VGAGTAGGRGRAPQRDPEEVARDTCLRLLAARPRTRAELESALAKRGTPEDVAARVLDRFAELRWVDDAAYAEGWVQSRHTSRGLSRRALEQELRRKGVGPETTETALAGLAPEAEEETAFRLARRRAAATAHLDREVRVRRLTGALLRRGYPSGLATRAVLAAVGEGPTLSEAAGEEESP
jgi:regulatory protein